MNISYWQIIRDDSKRTYEVIGQDSNVDHFNNSIVGMQRIGMSVSGLTPPVTNKNSSKASISFAGYRPEVGLHKRLQKEFMEITRREFEG